MPFYGDPDELDRTAQRLREHAQQVRERAAALRARCWAVEWVSTAADAFRARIGQDAEALCRAADELDGAAQALAAHAQTIRERLAQIRRIQQAATAWFAEQARRLEDLAGDAARALTDPGGTLRRLVLDPPWVDWPWTPERLPEPGHKDWLDVGEFLRRQGVPL